MEGYAAAPEKGIRYVYAYTWHRTSENTATSNRREPDAIPSKDEATLMRTIRGKLHSTAHDWRVLAGIDATCAMPLAL